MDESPEYIKMCACEEIQKFRPEPLPYQMPRRNPLDTFEYFQNDQVGNLYWSTPQGNIWLPCQDQLQEMVLGQKGIRETGLIGEFFLWYREYFVPKLYIVAYEDNYSMEQLWLAFVMKEKHNKVWNGEEWRVAQEGALVYG